MFVSVFCFVCIFATVINRLLTGERVVNAAQRSRSLTATPNAARRLCGCSSGRVVALNAWEKVSIVELPWRAFDLDLKCGSVYANEPPSIVVTRALPAVRVSALCASAVACTRSASSRRCLAYNPPAIERLDCTHYFSRTHLEDAQLVDAVEHRVLVAARNENARWIVVLAAWNANFDL